MLDLDVMHSNDKHDFLIDVNIIQEGFPQVVLIFENVDYVYDFRVITQSITLV